MATNDCPHGSWKKWELYRFIKKRGSLAGEVDARNEEKSSLTCLSEGGTMHTFTSLLTVEEVRSVVAG